MIVLLSNALVSATAFAQGAGSVSGRVENALSGNSLNLAKITVKGGNRDYFTNDYGDYQISGLPAGEVELTFAFTGLVSKTIAVTVTSGGNTVQNVSLANARYESRVADSGETVELDAFAVTAERDTNAASIAANEQRYSANLKNVVSADAFGDVTEGNVGEFMKFLPGVSVDYVAADVRTMAVRGFADNFTSISVNGARMASASSGASSRSFEFEQVSINNMARIEVTKAPLPSMPADSLGGAVNMVSKNAFERKGAAFKYRVYLSANSEDLDLFSKTPGPMNKATYKVLPGFDFDYTLPVSKTFGIVVTGLMSNQYNEQHRSQKTYNFAQAGATATNPYLQQYLFQDGPKNTFRRSASVKADWKIAPNQVLSASVQGNYYLSQFGNRNYTYNVGTSATSTPSGGTPLSWTETSVTGASGRGSVQGQTSFRDKYGATVAGNVDWSYNSGNWELGASVNGSRSRTWYRDTGRGHFNEVRSQMIGVSRISFTDINETRPGGIHVYNAAGQELDPTLYSNYSITFGRGSPIDASDEFVGGNSTRSIISTWAFRSRSSPAWICASKRATSDVGMNRGISPAR
ncbi:MAG: carboxypeptidase-like regulatory domain-containing protein [Opitutaceae bacterium]|nr:carboxypeptidase-like regulatory domain-containing protein [Opitutaceae bacterium]